MKRCGIAVTCLLSGLATITVARAALTDAEATFPYHGISERNVFNLKDPPPPPTNTPVVVQVPNLTLTMITTIFGDKRVGLKWPSPPKPGEPPKEESHILVVGQAEAGVEVLDADEVEGTVKVLNHGQPQTLNFANNGAKPSQAPPPIVPPPGARPIVIPTPQNPAAVPAAVTPNVNPALRSIPQRTLRIPTPPGQASPVPNPQGSAIFVPNNAQGSVIATPNAQAFAIGGGGPIAGQPTAPSPQHPEFTPEQQALIIEAQRKYYQERGDPIANILPPTMLTPKTTPQPTPNQSP